MEGEIDGYEQKLMDEKEKRNKYKVSEPIDREVRGQ